MRINDVCIVSVRQVRSCIRPHVKFSVSMVIVYGPINLPLGLCGYVLLHVLILSPSRVAKVALSNRSTVNAAL